MLNQSSASASTLSRGASGWLAARRYLEATGGRTTLLDTALDEAAPTAGVLVLAFPWQRFAPGESFHALDRHLSRGGTVVLAFSGESLSLAERAALEALGLAEVPTGFDPPLSPRRWWAFAGKAWSLRPEGAGAAVEVGRLAWMPGMPREGRLLYRAENGAPGAFAFPRRQGRVVVLPADALANARLANPGNADLLETLHRWLGSDWTFDEFHHGLVAATAPASAQRQHVLDLFLLQLLLLYALTVVALSRRFGPAWSDPPVIAATTREFLVGLGLRHHRLGHHAAAAERLLANLAELDPRLRLPARAPGDAGTGPEALLSLARRVGRLTGTRAS